MISFVCISKTGSCKVKIMVYLWRSSEGLVLCILFLDLGAGYTSVQFKKKKMSCVFVICVLLYMEMSFPGGARGKEPACQCRRHKRCRFDPWVGNISWRRRAWQPTLVFLLGESSGQRSLVGYGPWGCKSRTRLSD